MIDTELMRRNSPLVVLPAQDRHPWRAYMLCFAITFVALFLTTGRYVNLYDEGITLTAAFRVMSGQVPYRDFYFIYGPALAYLLAALFKLFGRTVFVAFIFDLVLKSAVGATFFAVARHYCNRWVSIFFTGLLIVWLFTLQLDLSAATPVSLFSLWTLSILLPAFSRVVTAWRFFATGVCAALASLFRFDAGFVLMLVVFCMIVAATVLHLSPCVGRMRQPLTFGLATVAGFAIILAPVLILYRSVAPWHGLYFDLFYYPAHFYRASRGLPLRHRADLGKQGELMLLIPGVTVVLAVIMAVRLWWRQRSLDEFAPEVNAVIGCLCAFGLLAAGMYVKSLVRIDLMQNYLALVPTLLLLAILFAHCYGQVLLFRGALYLVTVLCALCTRTFAAQTTRIDLDNKSFFFAEFAHPETQAPLPPNRNWCDLKTPATRHLCFLMDPDHIHMIEFLQANTEPGDTLYVGLSYHGRIFANDNATYFVSGLLPATRWSHMDPHLQNSVIVQQQMIEELTAHQPPYVVLDSEYSGAREPNDSAVDTGVRLLDDFIRQQYEPVRYYGELTILKRRPQN